MTTNLKLKRPEEMHMPIGVSFRKVLRDSLLIVITRRDIELQLESMLLAARLIYALRRDSEVGQVQAENYE